MAMNLRLTADAQAALRAKAARTGRSQQELIREAVDASLGMASVQPESGSGATSRDRLRDEVLQLHGLRAARIPYRELENLVSLPQGVHTSGLLDREDR